MDNGEEVKEQRDALPLVVETRRRNVGAHEVRRLALEGARP